MGFDLEEFLKGICRPGPEKTSSSFEQRAYEAAWEILAASGRSAEDVLKGRPPGDKEMADATARLLGVEKTYLGKGILKMKIGKKDFFVAFDFEDPTAVRKFYTMKEAYSEARPPCIISHIGVREEHGIGWHYYSTVAPEEHMKYYEKQWL